jgi:ribosome-associated toxin RatA of RatAB toxin-antitoxin module
MASTSGGPEVRFYNARIVKHVRKSVLLWYSPREMYDLVTAIDRYPQFLPWCDRADVLDHHDDGVTARLGLAYMGVRHAFTTRNLHVAPDSVTVQLVDGPFSLLAGTWLFKSLGRPGSDQPACKIEFDLRYAFSSPALESVVSPVFDRVANTFVDSFVRRAEDVYGSR